jgi:hypothetical protein
MIFTIESIGVTATAIGIQKEEKRREEKARFTR